MKSTNAEKIREQQSPEHILAAAKAGKRGPLNLIRYVEVITVLVLGIICGWMWVIVVIMALADDPGFVGTMLGLTVGIVFWFLTRFNE